MKVAKLYAIKSLDYNPNMLPSYLLIAKVYALSFDEDNALSYFQMAENRELIAASLITSGDWFWKNLKGMKKLN